MCLAILPLVGFLACVCASAPTSMVVLGSVPDGMIPKGFTFIGRPPGSQMLTLRIALENTDQEGLENTAYAVSTPGSSQYGQFLTPDETMCALRKQHWMASTLGSLPTASLHIPSHSLAIQSIQKV
ncbi:Protein arginine N-methyltransferase [Mycena chlorophos]|uniref:Protein arginine N-methyltransferase n=1 Tax=Mycena chlorophos TaxID=658473 RepID=A0A8H6WMX1_MYCCL|nr:Protein arginine N-methyltransferase [Mycena chlorophos]